MWKWILGCIALLVAIVMWRGFVKYRQFTAGGNTATVSIAATRERVYASLSNADSLTTWMAGNSVHTARTGKLQVGDKIEIETTGDNRSRGSRFAWTVTELRSGELVALSLRNDTIGGVLALRRDSLVTAGDSTRVVTTFSSPLLEAVNGRTSDSAGVVRKTMAGFGMKLFTAAFRTETEFELNRLKEHIEGHRNVKAERER